MIKELEALQSSDDESESEITFETDFSDATSDSSSSSECSNQVTFQSLNVSDWLVRILGEMSMVTPTDIQKQCIPNILKLRDCIGIAKTGSGKTAAYAVPLLQNWSEDPFGIYGLILVPTRELVSQIAEQFKAFGSSMNLRVAPIVGGMDMLSQSLEILKKPHFVIATPGRLADIVRSSDEAKVSFSRVKAFVLDEADRLLQPSFSQELSDCLNIIPSADKRQNLLFTATFTDAIRHFQAMPQKNGKQAPILIDLIANDSQRVIQTLSQYYCLAPSHMKMHYLYKILQKYQKKSVIIFVNKSSTVELSARTLKLLGVRCTALHSQLPQRERNASLGRFKAEVIQILLATDVAGRGLDIPFVELVINFDLPRNPDDYIHRVGRTARAGRSGEAISIISEREIKLVEAIESNIGSKFEELADINENTIIESLNKVSKAIRRAKMSMFDDNFGEKKFSHKNYTS